MRRFVFIICLQAFLLSHLSILISDFQRVEECYIILYITSVQTIITAEYRNLEYVLYILLNLIKRPGFEICILIFIRQTMSIKYNFFVKKLIYHNDI